MKLLSKFSDNLAIKKTLFFSLGFSKTFLIKLPVISTSVGFEI